MLLQTFCVKLSDPKGGLVWFQIKFYYFFSPDKMKSVISDATFLDVFNKDRYGFSLSASEMQVDTPPPSLLFLPPPSPR